MINLLVDRANDIINDNSSSYYIEPFLVKAKVVATRRLYDLSGDDLYKKVDIKHINYILSLLPVVRSSG
jgi:hypothetical protein